MKTVPWKWLIVIFGVFLITSCGGGGDGGGGSAVSGHVPYLISAPVVTYTKSTGDSTKYDVTVTLEADGPTGVMFVGLWIIDAADDTNFTHLDLTNIPNTKRWTATTDSYLPLPPGQYYIDDIVLEDGDPSTAQRLRTGWYFSDTVFSNFYFVDETEETLIPAYQLVFYNFGISGIPITRFTLP